MKKQKVAVVCIDPQYDFHDLPDRFKSISSYDENDNPVYIEPALPVPGSWNDSLRLAEFLKKFKNQINSIFISFDTHQQYDIAHQMYWRDASGNHPGPFTQISNNDIKQGKWMPVDPGMMSHVLDYTEALEKEGKYKLIVWPTHCIVGTPGYSVVQPVMDSVLEWERTRVTRFIPLAKGHNPHTEHYGGCEAEFPMPNDATTRLNRNFIDAIEKNDMVIITGQALSHCVASTVRQIATYFDEENIKKLVLLVDTSSSVSGFEKDGQDFISEMSNLGMRVAKTTAFFTSRENGLEFKGESL